MINRDFFLQQIRKSLFDGSLKQAQVDGLTALLDEWENKHAHEDDRWFAYMLATAHHETDRKLQPIDEYGGPSYFKSMYDIEGSRPSLAKKNGNTTPGDGVKFHGRGFVQLTWKNNYAAMTPVVGFDLTKAPDRAKELGPATKILFYGMTNGTFTGYKLSDFFSPSVENWPGARKIINGTDKKDLVADYGKAYYAALSYTT